jgi:hypothetical protein
VEGLYITNAGAVMTFHTTAPVLLELSGSAGGSSGNSVGLIDLTDNLGLFGFSAQLPFGSFDQTFSLDASTDYALDLGAEGNTFDGAHASVSYDVLSTPEPSACGLLLSGLALFVTFVFADRSWSGRGRLSPGTIYYRERSNGRMDGA